MNCFLTENLKLFWGGGTASQAGAQPPPQTGRGYAPPHWGRRNPLPRLHPHLRIRRLDSAPSAPRSLAPSAPPSSGPLLFLDNSSTVFEYWRGGENGSTPALVFFVYVYVYDYRYISLLQHLQCNIVAWSVLSGTRAGWLINSVHRIYHNKSKAKQTTSTKQNVKRESKTERERESMCLQTELRENGMVYQTVVWYVLH